MVEIIEYGKFKPIGKQNKKKQIILTHTTRNAQNYLQSLKYRMNGKYEKIPNYLITKDGKILKFLEDNEHSKYFDEININRNSIIITLENLGWLEKEPLKDFFINWIGDIYKGLPFERRWRDYFYWDPYSEMQIDTLVKLTNVLTDKMKIKKQIIGHNTRVKDIEKFEGIVTKSNFDSICTHISPAFDFEFYKNKCNYE